MKISRAVLAFIAPLAMWAQGARPAEPGPDTVLATFGGKSITYGELKTFMGVLPPQMQQMAMRDRKAFIQQFALLSRLAELAEKAKRYDESPTKEALQFQRMYVMANAQMSAVLNEMTVAPEDVRRLYDASRDRFTQARVKVLYVSFSPDSSLATVPGGKKYLGETDARVKIEKILADIRKGADFVKMVKQYSEDATSVAKDGDFGTIRRNDNVPEPIRAAIFALKPGQVSEPVRQPNGFYLFRVDEISVRPFVQVSDELFNELKQARFKQWMDQTQRDLNLKFENEAFFNAPPAAPVAPPKPPQPKPQPK